MAGKPKRKPKAAADTRRENQQRYARKLSQAAREIGPLPKARLVKKRKACRLDLKRFLETFLAGRFRRPWGQLHLNLIASLQAKLLGGGRQCEADPRGSGKTSIIVGAAIWAALNGHRRYLVLAGATAEAGADLLKDFRDEIESNELLAAAFPEVVYPIAQLEGLMTRAAGQTLKGERTRIAWSNRTAAMPTIRGSASSGVVLRSFGLTGSIRGLKRKVNGQQVRPDFVLADDPQTRQSAKSPIQVRHRLQLLTSDLPGLSGPGESLAMFVAGTIIEQGDVMDQLTDRKKHPVWQGVRVAFFTSLPTDTDGWAEYARIRNEELAAGGTGDLSTAYYAANQVTLDAGAVVSWPARKEESDISAIQHGMNLKLDLGEEGFASEYQNAPLASASTLATALALSAVTLAAKVTPIPRGTVPREAVKLTCGVDVQEEVLVWLLAAWSKDGSGHVVDYGTWPEQPVDVWTTASVPNPLSKLCPGSPSARWYAGITGLAKALAEKEWPRQELDDPARIEKIAIDAGYGKSTDTVYGAIRRSPHAALLVPSHGRGIGPARQPMALWNLKPGEQAGIGYRIQTAAGAVRGRHLVVDTNQWKSRVAAGVRQPHGSTGTITFCAGTHPLLFQHLAAEYPTATSGPYGSVDVWAIRPEAAGQNHYWDALILAAVLANVLGISASPLPAPAARLGPPPAQVSYADMARVANESKPEKNSGQVSYRELALAAKGAA